MVTFQHWETVETDSPIVQAAFELAEKAHKLSGQKRGKSWPGRPGDDMPYLAHPIMLHDLLQHFGVTDEITLACALLHDAKEDYEPYKQDPQLMERELAEKLSAAGMVDADGIAAYIDEICTELTNARVMVEGKRTWQVEHVGKISPRAAMVKVVDQMASILDNIISPDDNLEPGGNRWSRNWAYKALDVVKATASRNPELASMRDMFKVLFAYNMKLIDADAAHAEDPTNTEAAELRAAFSFDLAEEKARTLEENKKPDVLAAVTLDHTRAGVVETGAVQVKLSGDGEVTHYAILANPRGDKNELRNETAIDFMGALEESSTMRRVTVGPREVINGRIVRLNKIKPPIAADEFIALAKDSHALEKSFTVQIQNEARALVTDRGIG